MLFRRRGWMEFDQNHLEVVVLVLPEVRTSFRTEFFTGEPYRPRLPSPHDTSFCRRLQDACTPFASSEDLSHWAIQKQHELLSRACLRGQVLVARIPHAEWPAQHADAYHKSPLGSTTKSTAVKSPTATASPKRNANPPAEAPPATVAPLPPAKNTVWIEIRLIGDDEQPLGGERYSLTLPDDVTEMSRFPTSGKLRKDDLDPGTCRFALTELDQGAWSTESGGGSETLTTVGGSANHHEINDGSSTCSVAAAYHFAPTTVWDDPDNKKLRQLRKHPNLLFAGDALAIPARKRKEVTLATNVVHTFKCHGTRTLVAIRVLEGDAARGQQSWTCTAGRTLSDGSADKGGVVEVWLTPTDRQVDLTIGEDKLGLDLQIDHLNPINEITGVRQRLTNLGFWGDGVEQTIEEQTTAAVLSFQVLVGVLDKNGDLDDATTSKLVELHDQRDPFPSEAQEIGKA